MLSQSKGKSSKTVIERPGISWKDSMDSSSLILSLVKEAAMLAPIVELKKAACTALLVFKTTQIVKENKEAYEQLGYDSSELIVAIWRSFKKAEDPEEWLSAEMRDILEDLSNTLENIRSFLSEQLSRKYSIRVIFSRADGVKINKYREHLNYAMQKFELQSHMNINDVLRQVLKKNDQISEQIIQRDEEEVKHALLETRARDARDREIAEKFQEEEWEISQLEWLKQVEINHHQAEDERWHSDELKKIEKEAKNRKSELERLREAAWAFEEANRLRQAEEEEIVQLKRTLAAEEDNRRSEKKSSRQEDEVDEEEVEEWDGNPMVEEASEEGEELPVRKISKVKRNASGSLKRQPVRLEDSTDDDEGDLQSCFRLTRRTARRKLSSASLPEEDLRSLRSAKARMALRSLSNASSRVQETEDDYTDEEDDYAPAAPASPRKSLKVKRKPQTRNVDDLMDRFQGFMQSSPHWNGSNSRSRSPIYMPPGMHSNPYSGFPTYGGSFSPPIGPYGYGVGMPGTIVYAGVGNTTNTTMANVGNDNSVVKNLKDHAVEVILNHAHLTHTKV